MFSFSDATNIEGVKRKNVVALDALGIGQHPRGRQPHLCTFRWAGLPPKGRGLEQSSIRWGLGTRPQWGVWAKPHGLDLPLKGAHVYNVNYSVL